MVAAVTWLDPLESFLHKNIQLGGVDGFTWNNLQDNNYYVKKAKYRKNIYCYLKKKHTCVCIGYFWKNLQETGEYRCSGPSRDSGGWGWAAC